MDASTVGQTTVTVAVHTSREQEPEILESIYDYGDDLGFKPFYNKSNDFDHAARRDFTEAVIHEHRSDMMAFAHSQQHDKNVNTQQIEAIHSAIHVDNILSLPSDDEPLVIIDGNQQQATPFVKALSGIRRDLPVVGHCQKSEYYYPAALLADLTCNHLAHRIENGATPAAGDLTLPVAWANHEHGDRWGRAASGMYETDVDYTPPGLPARRGESVRERVNCWFEGAMARDRGAGRPMTDSLRPVINHLRRNGYENLAANLEEI